MLLWHLTHCCMTCGLTPRSLTSINHFWQVIHIAVRWGSIIYHNKWACHTRTCLLPPVGCLIIHPMCFCSGLIIATGVHTPCYGPINQTRPGVCQFHRNFLMTHMSWYMFNYYCRHPRARSGCVIFQMHNIMNGHLTDVCVWRVLDTDFSNDPLIFDSLECLGAILGGETRLNIETLTTGHYTHVSAIWYANRLSGVLCIHTNYHIGVG